MLTNFFTAKDFNAQSVRRFIDSAYQRLGSDCSQRYLVLNALYDKHIHNRQTANSSPLKWALHLYSSATGKLDGHWRQAGEFNANGFLPCCWPSTKSIKAGTLAATLSVFALIFISQVRATQTDYQAVPSQRLQSQLHKVGLTDIYVTANERDQSRLTISGLVTTEADIGRARDIITASDTLIDELNIQLSSYLVDAIDEVLHQLDLEHLSTEYAGGGKITVTGYVGDDRQWREALSLLRRDFPNLTGVDHTRVTTLSTRLAKLNEYISEAGLKGKLETTVKNQDITISGSLDHAEMSAWKSTATHFRNLYGTQPRLISQVALIKPGQRPSLEISGTMVTANKRFLVTSDGTVYSEGQSLPDGSIIKHIENRRIILSRQNHDYVYPFFGRG